MNRKKLSKFLIVLAFLIFGAQWLGERLAWDVNVWCFDIVMHFLGGFWSALFFIWFYKPKDLSWKPVLMILGSLLLVGGLFWEVYEYYVFNVIGKTPFDSFDTFTDILVDLAGGLFALFYFCKNRIVPKKKE